MIYTYTCLYIIYIHNVTIVPYMIFICLFRFQGIFFSTSKIPLYNCSHTS